MKRHVMAWTLALLVALPLQGMAQKDLQAILSDPARPQEDRNRDAGRAPARVIEFFGIGAGDRVADLLAGGGYWTRILVPLVGPSGRVYAGIADPMADPPSPILPA